MQPSYLYAFDSPLATHTHHDWASSYSPSLASSPGEGNPAIINEQYQIDSLSSEPTETYPHLHVPSKMWYHHQQERHHAHDHPSYFNLAPAPVQLATSHPYQHSSFYSPQGEPQPSPYYTHNFAPYTPQQHPHDVYSGSAPPPQHERQLSTASIQSFHSAPELEIERGSQSLSPGPSSVASGSPLKRVPLELQHMAQQERVQLQEQSVTPGLLDQSLRADGRPKRPMNAFLIFARHRRPMISREQPELKTGEISGILSAEWAALGDEKAAWRNQARILREAFNERYPEYVYERSANGTRKAGSRGGRGAQPRQVAGSSQPQTPSRKVRQEMVMGDMSMPMWQAQQLQGVAYTSPAPRYEAHEHAYHPYAYTRPVHHEQLYSPRGQQQVPDGYSSRSWSGGAPAAYHLDHDGGR